jgi:hypothetical protein
MNDRATRVRVVGPLARYADGFAAVLAQRDTRRVRRPAPAAVEPGRYKPPDALLAFLEAL